MNVCSEGELTEIVINQTLTALNNQNLSTYNNQISKYSFAIQNDSYLIRKKCIFSEEVDKFHSSSISSI